MDEAIKDQIIKLLVDSKVLKEWKENVESEETIQIDTNEGEDIGVLSDGTRYSKKAVFNYLCSQNVSMTEQNISMAAKMFPINNNNELVSKTMSTERHNEAENLSEEDLSKLIQAKIAASLSELNDNLIKLNLCDYVVDVITDKSNGGTNVTALEYSLKKYSEKGYRVKQMFTNELGVNSTTVGIGGISAGVNATMDQVVIVYERPRLLTDYMVRSLMKEL